MNLLKYLDPEELQSLRNKIMISKIKFNKKNLNFFLFIIKILSY
jgi:hypothetical protein